MYCAYARKGGHCFMKVIGITGPSGAGKSLLCRFLEEKNIPCIDADAVYHSLLLPPSECLDAVRRAFGDDVFSGEQLDRSALGAAVFGNKDKLELLNKTVLDYVLVEIRRIISDYARQGFSTVAVDAPTLIESGFDKECTTVISVTAPENARLLRIIERDLIPEEKALMRIRAQKSDEFYREHSDIVIENSGSLEEFQSKIIKLLDGGVLSERGTDGTDKKD